MQDKPVLVTGATGYVGGRVVLRLLKAGYKVQATGRSFEKLKARSWADHPNVELARADLLDLESVKKAAEGCCVAYYFVHVDDIISRRFCVSGPGGGQEYGASGRMGKPRSNHLSWRAHRW